MVNRTLRRSYSETRQSNDAVRDTVDSESERVTELAGGIENTDTESNSDGSDNERNADGASGSIGVVTIDPEHISDYIANGGTDSGDSGTGKRTRRKRGPNKRTLNKKSATETIEPFLGMVHTLAATVLKTPELLLEDDECKQLSNAYVEFCKHHDVPVLSEKRMSEVQLVSAMFMIYGPRVFAMRARWKEEAAARRAKNVTPIQQRAN